MIRMNMNRRGSALLQVLIVLMVCSILAVTLLSLSDTGFKQTRNSENKSQAYCHARSGVEIARKLFDNNFATTYSLIPFYCYGDLLGPLTTVSGVYPGGNPLIDDKEVLFQVTQVPVGSVSTITITATGTIKSMGMLPAAKEIQTYVFNYSPQIPYTPTNCSDAGPSALGWHPVSGDLNAGIQLSMNPVLFSRIGGITKNIAPLVNLTAPALYFEDVTKSLSIQDNMTLTLNAKIIKFAGPVVGGASIGTSLTLNVNNSNIDGSTIGGANGVKYGVIYIGSTVSNVILAQGAGCYYFPDNINLFLQADIDRLIKINNLSTVNLVQLGTTMTFFKSSGYQ